jgi:hypothetical protein
MECFFFMFLMCFFQKKPQILCAEWITGSILLVISCDFNTTRVRARMAQDGRRKTYGARLASNARSQKVERCWL